MLKIKCNEKRPRFEMEPLADGRTLVRLYEDEEAARFPAVSDMDTPWNGYRYTTYETQIALPAGALERFHNPKYPQDYIQRIDDILRQKDEIFRLLEQTRA